MTKISQQSLILVSAVQLQNRYGTLHGGCIATIVDTVGSAALVTRSPISGVSLSISTEYYAPLQGGEEGLIQAQVVFTMSHMMRTYAPTSCWK